MTNRVRRWSTAAIGVAIAIVIAVVEIRRYGSAFDGALDVAIIGGYVVALLVLRSRSETAGVLAGEILDERWQLINQRALALTGQLIAAVLVAAFIVADATGGNAGPYAWTAALVGATYLGGILWYRWRM